MLLVSVATTHGSEIPAFMNPVVVSERGRFNDLVKFLRDSNTDPKDKDAAVNAWIDRQLRLCQTSDDAKVRFEFACFAVGFAVEKRRLKDAVTLQKYMIDGVDPLQRKADQLATLGGIYELMAKEAELPERASELRDQARAIFEESRIEASRYAGESPAAFKRLILSFLDEAAILHDSSQPEHVLKAAELCRDAGERLQGKPAAEKQGVVYQEAVAELSRMGVTPVSIRKQEDASRAKFRRLETSGKN
ncbi:hypothetical protein [Planctomicrobium sp. SH527]|uniref:hypothetical protein n=1 Tax=Planctomicrobium sp. SH527 TaxID=3448123 RepID=UPI003F5BB150